MADNKIAFILCVNDMDEYAECKYYIDRLKVPEGYETEVITIEEAPSMTAGYQAGMLSTDAKYKVYLHQDVFLINQNFIPDMLAVFAENPTIGILGMIGTTKLGKYARAVVDWDAGKILHNCNPNRLEFEFPENGMSYQEVQAVDGLLLATQQDVRWREDLFDGWDFYDISQCMEFLRAGKLVVVPRQEVPWCYHDNSYSKMSHYYEYCTRFAKEYQDIASFETAQPSARAVEYEKLREQSRMELETLVEEECRDELIAVFAEQENRGYLHLVEFELLAEIEAAERKSTESDLEEKRLWKSGMGAKKVHQRLQKLKHLVKRLEFDAGDAGAVTESIRAEYTRMAFEIVRRND